MRVVRKVETMKGPGIVNNPAGIAFYQPPAPRQVIQQGARFVTFKISSVVTSQTGRYNAKTFSGGIDAAATGNLAEADLGTLAEEDDAVVWHPAEISGAGALLGGNIYRGQIVGTNAEGLKVILVSDETASVILKVTGYTSPSTLGNNWYYATKQVRNTTAFNPATNFTVTSYFSDSTEGSVYCYSLVDSGGTVRAVTLNTYHRAWLRGFTAAGVAVYEIDGLSLACAS